MIGGQIPDPFRTVADYDFLFRAALSLSELNGVIPSTLFGVFGLLGGWGSRPCEESADGGRVDSK